MESTSAKILPVLFFSLCLFLSCQNTNRSQTAEQDDMEEVVDTTPKATAIFWVDKGKNKLTAVSELPTPIRTVKAKVDVDSTGKVEIISYVKPQSPKIKRYLQHRLEIFRVKKVMIDSGYVKLGEQYVQLRYIIEKMEKYR